MTDLLRVEKLSASLSHDLPAVRLRAVQNLQFKLVSNVLGEGMYSSTSCMRNLADGIASSLQLLLSSAGGEWLEPSSTQARLLDELLQLAVLIGQRSSLAPEAAAGSFATLLERLYAVLARSEPGAGPVQRLVHQAIEAVCAIKSVSLAEAAGMLRAPQPADYDPVPAELLHRPFTSSALRHAAMSADGHSPGLTQSQSQAQLQRGAGAILNSSLVYSGWKFHRVVLTDADERHLFDLEVKVKLGHDTAVQLLWDALNDFPAPALVSRPTLLAALLDLVGSVYPQDQSTGGLSPCTAMSWLETLLGKATKAFVVHLEGSLCSSIPASSVPTVEAEEGSSEFGKPTLAAQMTRAMHALRYPVLDGSNAPGPASHGAAAASLRVSPAPSLPGLAFACCAAALPLLQGRDNVVAAQVLSLLRVALPLVQEPAVVPQAASGAAAPLGMVDRKRLQHLLNRSEQMLRFFDVPLSVDRVIRLCHPHTPAPANNARSDPSSRQSTVQVEDAVPETNPVHRVAQAAFEAVLLRAVVQILLAVPPASVEPARAEGAVPADAAPSASAAGLELGPLTLSVIQDIVASGGGSTDLLEQGPLGMDPSACCVERSLIALLKAADPAAEDGIQYACELLQSVHALRQMAENSDSVPSSSANGVASSSSSRAPPTAFLLEKLLERAHDVVNMLDSGAESLAEEIGSIGQTIPGTACVLLAVAVARSGHDSRQLMIRDAAVASALRLLTRLLSCCGQAVRAETCEALLSLLSAGQSRPLSREQLDLLRRLRFSGLGQDCLLAALASPAFVHALVLFGLLGADGADLSYGDRVVVSGGGEVVPSAVRVLDQLCMHMLTTEGLDVSIAGPWSVLLCPLKTCDWCAPPGSPSALPHAVLSFTALLEDVCAGSAGGSRARTAYGLSLSLGLFHAAPAVRARSAGRLRYELVGLRPDGDDAGLSDPFAASAPVQLSSWADLQTAANSSPVQRAYDRPAVPTRLANHSECRKLAGIAFGAGHDASIRTAALSQLRLVLEDRHVMATAEGGWCVATAARCCEALGHWSAECGGDSGSVGGTAEGARLAAEAAALLRHLVCESLSVRGATVFWPLHLAGPLDVSLFPVIHAALRPAPARSHGRAGASEAEAQSLQVQALCSQVLAALVHDGARWSEAIHAAEGAEAGSADPAWAGGAFSTVAATSVCGSGGSAARPDASRLGVPAFLSGSYHYPVPAGVEGHADVWPFEVVVLRCEMGDRAKRTRPLPSRRAMALVVAAAFAPPAETVLAELGSAVCALMATAEGHKPLRILLHAARALGAALPVTLGAMVSQDLRLALSRLLSVAPRSRNDHSTLCSALDLLTAAIAACTAAHAKEAQARAGGWTVLHACSLLIEDVTLAALGPLYPLLEGFRESTAGAAMASLSPGFASRDHVSKDQAVEMAYARARAQHCLLSLLSALASAAYPLASLSALQAGAHPLPHLLVQLLSSELVPSWKRSLAGAVLEALADKHGVRASLAEGLTSDASFDGLAASVPAHACSLDLLLRSVKLLRTPDTLRGNGALLSALRLLFLYSGQVCAARAQGAVAPAEAAWWAQRRDWQWILRLGWDRRAEVRVLTMTLLRNLIIISPAAVGISGSASLTMTADSLSEGQGQGQGQGQQWPPLDALMHVVLDASESHATRAAALEALLQCPGASAGPQGRDRLAGCVAACLDLVGQPSSRFGRMQESGCVAPSSMNAALCCLLQMLSAGAGGGSSPAAALPASDCVALLRSLSALPCVMSLLQSDTRGLAEHAALARVGLVEPSSEATHAHFSGFAGFRPTAADKCYTLAGGWEGLWAGFVRGTNDAAVSLLVAAACRVVNVAAALSPGPAPPADPLQVMLAAKQTSLLRGLAGLLASAEGLLATQEDSAACVAADRRTAACGDCLVVMLGRDGARDALAAVIQSDPSLPGRLLQRATIRLEQVLLSLESISSVGSVCAGLSGALKALCLLLGHGPFVEALRLLDWSDAEAAEVRGRTGAGVGAGSSSGSDESEDSDSAPAPSPIKAFSQALYRLRAALLGLESDRRELQGGGRAQQLSGEALVSTSARPWAVLGPRLDGAIGFWTQALPSARDVMYAMTAGGAPSPAFPLLDHYIETLAAAAQELARAPKEAPDRTRLAQQQQQQDMHRSLQSLKKKTRGAATGPDSPVLTGGPVSPVVRARLGASGGSLSNSKWRMKARGYSWKQPPSPPSAAAAAAASQPLWAALLALSGCASHPAATRRCIDLGLPQALSALLRTVGAGRGGGGGGPSSVAASVGASVGAGAAGGPDVAAAVVAATCAFAGSGEAAKAALSHASAAPCALTASTFGSLPAPSSSSHALHQLVALGLGPPSSSSSSSSSSSASSSSSSSSSSSFAPAAGAPPETRYALLSLAASLLSAGSAAPTLQKAAVSQVLSLALQRSLCTGADPEATPYLLHCLSACLVAEARAGGAAGPKSSSDGRASPSPRESAMRDITNGSGRAVAADSDFRPVGVPHLLEWVAETHSGRPDFLAACVRFIAALGGAALEGQPGAAHPSAKRLLSTACAPEPLRLLVAALGSEHSALSALGSLSLWVLLHSSEGAKARLRELADASSLAACMQRRPDPSYGKEGTRARHALLGLLQHNSV